ncbi:MAG: phosphonate C-P lyase system protein PhnH [Bosea sp.]|jgi:alpha-D-ribose 1-methylphosphonate 5-triphosphate synthase subunit PhnH|nr:phosphonate C-P lyase system protein PhnH [Bosea sp. (in: a-proteobacteria)]
MTTTAQARPSLAEGFSNSVFDSQSTFRSAMEALARPGRIRPIGADILPDAPLLPSAAGLILALCDFETPLYLSPHLAALPGVAAFLRFHSGVPLVAEPSRAAFALLDLAHDRLDLGSFAQGTPEYPDRSTTIIACCTSLQADAALFVAGPGIADVAQLHVPDLPPDFIAQWAANRASFPLGVDMIFAAPGALVGLPRSARIIGEAY